MKRALVVVGLAAACSGDSARTAPQPPGALRLTQAPPAPTGTAPAATAASPIEKFLAGDRTFGIFALDQAPCERAAWDATAAALGAAATVVYRPDEAVAETTFTAGAIAGGVIGDLQKIFVALRDAGGTDLDGQHVCVVAARGIGPGLSTSNGFIAFDPADVLEMNDLIPDDTRTMYSTTVIYAHELAHQLQYRYGNPFQDERTVRRTELAADCMGTAFAAMTQPDGWIMDEVEKGAVGALQTFADLKFASTLHHGTPVDRGRMARYGIGLVATARKQGQALDLATIKAGCELAVRGWDASMPLTPPDQLWGGAALECTGRATLQTSEGEKSCYPYMCQDGRCLESCRKDDDCAGAHNKAELAEHGWPLQCVNSRCVPLPPEHVRPTKSPN